MVFFYCPCAFNELFAAKIIAGFALFFELAFNYVLSCDTCVVCSGYPKSVVALHAVVAYNNVLQCIVKTVPHVKHACDVRRRNDDRICVCFFVAVFALAFVLCVYRGSFVRSRLEIALTVPFFVNSVLKGFRLVSLFQFNRFHQRPLYRFIFSYFSDFYRTRQVCISFSDCAQLGRFLRNL